MHTFASIGACRIHLSKLTIMLLFCPFLSDDAFYILLLEVKAIISNGHWSAIAELVTSTGHNLRWDHFELSPGGKLGTHCKIKETSSSY